VSDEPRLDLATLAAVVPFLGVGLALLGARAVAFGISDGSGVVTLVGAVAFVSGAAIAWSGFRRARRRS
jgi:hypothetical protein